MADLGIGPWGEEPTPPSSWSTNRPAETIEKKGGTSYVFVTEGIEAAMERAKAAAGDQDVSVMGRGRHRSAVPQRGVDRRDSPARGADAARWRESVVRGVRPDLTLVAGEASSEPGRALTYTVESSGG